MVQSLRRDCTKTIALVQSMADEATPKLFFILSEERITRVIIIFVLMKTTENSTIPVRPPFRGAERLIHVAAWALLLGVPFFFTGRDQQELTAVHYLRTAMVSLSFMFVFYANYCRLVSRFLFKKQMWKFLLYNFLLIVTIMLVVHILMRLLPQPDWHRPPRVREWQEMAGFFLLNFMLYSLVAGLSVAIRTTSGWYEMESVRKEFEKSRAEAELQNLKSQLNPHFLFNTLNNIYSLIAISPERAQEVVHDLSRLLRYVLYESSEPFVPLEKDLDFIRNYVELMRIRLPEHVELRTYIEEVPGSASIAPLLFISPIENAFKHGVSNNKPSFIGIDIRMKDGRVVCSIRNSYFPKDAGHDKSGSGIGLLNLQRRLELIYPSRHIFSYGQEGETYKCVLELKL